MVQELTHHKYTNTQLSQLVQWLFCAFKRQSDKYDTVDRRLAKLERQMHMLSDAKSQYKGKEEEPQPQAKLSPEIEVTTKHEIKMQPKGEVKPNMQEESNEIVNNNQDIK